jgi:hypothetical protein
MSYEAPSHDTVELPLGMKHHKLLHQMRSQYQCDLDIMTILNICWILTIHPFCPASVIYLEYHPWDRVCHISNTSLSGSCVYALELKPEHSLKGFAHNAHLAHSEANMLASSTNSAASDTGKQFFTTTVRFSGGGQILPESQVCVKAGVSI